MELTTNQLRGYNGSNPSKPIYLSVKGKIYDVSSSRNFYGPGGSYEVFAGRECARALAKMSKSDSDISGDISDLTEKEATTLQDWENKFNTKYPVVGRLINSV